VGLTPRLCSRGSIARRKTGVLPDALIARFDPAEEPAAHCRAAARERLGDDLVVVRVISRGRGDEAGADRVVEDAAEKVARAYRARAGSAILVRPDGHVAWRSPTADRRGIESWLDGVLGLKNAHPAPHGFADA
jgi:hypothetical protein